MYYIKWSAIDVERCSEIFGLLLNADADVNAVEDTSMDIEGRRKIMSVSISIFFN